MFTKIFESSKKGRIAVQLGTPFAIFLLITFSALFLSSAISLDRARTYASSLTRQIAQQAGDKVIIFFQDLRRELWIAARTVNEDFSISLEGEKFLDSIMGGGSGVFELTFFDASGTQLFNFSKATTGSITDQEEVFHEPYFTTPLQTGQIYFSPPFISEHKVPFVFWSFPIKDSWGEIYGVMRATIDVSTLWTRLYNFSQLTGQIYILDENNTLIFSNDLTDESLKDLTSVFHERDWHPAKEQNTEYEGVSGQRVFGYTYNLHLIPWRVLAEVPLKSIFGALYLNFLILGGSLVLLIFVISCEIFIFRKKLSQPMKVLVKKIIDFGQGKKTTFLDIKVNNELSILAESFSNMTQSLKKSREKLKKYNQQLERQVASRTKELETRNTELEQFNKIVVGREMKMVELKEEITKLQKQLDMKE